MRKVCVFVEGQTEQVFVREFLLKWHQYQGVSVECYRILSKSTLPAEYDIPNPDAHYHYQIVNVGNDGRVLSWLLERVPGLRDEGYEIVVGLRDMYCQKYREKSSEISADLNQIFRDIVQTEIEARLQKGASIVSFHFAVMEIEAWMLAMYPSLLKKFPSLTVENLSSVYDFDADIEQTIFHPADTLNEVFMLSGDTYDKHKSDANSILSCIDKSDFELLYNSGRCQSFRLFVDSLLNIE